MEKEDLSKKKPGRVHVDIGAHLSIARGYAAIAAAAGQIGASTFQFFSRNPRGGKARAFDEKDLSEYARLRRTHNLGPLCAHGPYTLNPAGEGRTREFAAMVLQEDIERMDTVGVENLCIHPGSHGKAKPEDGVARVISLLNEVLREDQKITVLLETMSGQGGELGAGFEQLRAILDGVRLNDKLGICLDTAHVYAAGYDVVNHLDEVMEEFDRILSLDRLRVIHLNDSQMPLGSNRDRHALLGEGDIGFEALMRIVTHPGLRHLPFILETPTDNEGHRAEFIRIREAVRAAASQPRKKKRG